MTDLDGIYTESTTMINRDGKESVFFPYDHVVLELQGDRFKYWHFSHGRAFPDHPLTGEFTREGEKIELKSNATSMLNKQFVATIIKGVPAIWPADELQAWKNGEYPTTVPALVRVADGPSGDALDQTTFKFPKVTPLLDKEAAAKKWEEEQKKHEARYLDVPDPLRTLLRAKSKRNDGNLDAYRKLVIEQQKNPDPKLVKQLIAETGNGVSIVVGPMTLKDLYGHGALSSDAKAFDQKDASQRKALESLVSAMPEAKNSQALNAALMIFIRTTGLFGIDLTCADGTQVKITSREGRSTTKSYDFNETVAAGCEAWAHQAHGGTLCG